MLKDNLKKLLELEDELVIMDRSRGKFSMKISSIVLLIFATLYLFSPIDIVPEAVVKPKLAGYIDDAILWIFVGFYVFKDLYYYIPKERRDLDNVKLGRVQKQGDSSGESKVSNRDECISESSNVSDGGSSIDPNSISSILSSGNNTASNSNSRSATSDRVIHHGNDFEEDSLQ